MMKKAIKTICRLLSSLRQDADHVFPFNFDPSVKHEAHTSTVFLLRILQYGSISRG